MSDKKTELLELIAASGEWAAPSEFAQALKISAVYTNVQLRALAGEGLIQCMKPPKGFGIGIRKIYARLGLAPAEGAAPLDAKKARRAKHAKRKHHPRVVIKKETRGTSGKPSQRIEVLNTGKPQWAFTSENLLVLLGTPIAIKQHEARELVKFLREIDEAGFLGAGAA